jgi:hypothetical protein
LACCGAGKKTVACAADREDAKRLLEGRAKTASFEKLTSLTARNSFASITGAWKLWVMTRASARGRLAIDAFSPFHRGLKPRGWDGF